MLGLLSMPVWSGALLFRVNGPAHADVVNATRAADTATSP